MSTLALAQREMPLLDELAQITHVTVLQKHVDAILGLVGAVIPNDVWMGSRHEAMDLEFMKDGGTVVRMVGAV